MAALSGRPSVEPTDVQRVALPVLRHRIATNFQAQAEGMTTDDLVRRLLADVEFPKPERRTTP